MRLPAGPGPPPGPAGEGGPDVRGSVAAGEIGGGLRSRWRWHDRNGTAPTAPGRPSAARPTRPGADPQPCAARLPGLRGPGPGGLRVTARAPAQCAQLAPMPQARACRARRHGGADAGAPDQRDAAGRDSAAWDTDRPTWPGCWPRSAAALHPVGRAGPVPGPLGGFRDRRRRGAAPHRGGPRGGRRFRCPLGRRHRAAAGGDPVRRQGHHRRRRGEGHVRFAADRGPDRHGGRRRRGPAAGGRRHPGGHGGDHRIRHGRRAERPLRRRAEPVGPRALDRGLLHRFRRRAGRWPVPVRAGHGHRRIDPHPVGLLRHHGAEAHLRAAAAHRRGHAVLVPGPRGARWA